MLENVGAADFTHFPWLLSALFGWVLFLLLLLMMSPFPSANSSLQTFNPRIALVALLRTTNSKKQHMAFLDLFRVGAICWVISNHLGSEGRLDVLLGLPHGSPSMPIPSLAPLSVWFQGIRNSALGVEIFLVLSGLLAARSWHRRWQSHLSFWRNSMNFLFHRWLRLAPTSLAFVFLAAGTSRHLFPLFHQTMASNCTQTQLIAHALLFNNWNPPTCFSYLWHLGLDWQCHLLAPFLLHCLSRRQRAGSIILISLIVGSVFLRGFKCISNGICNKSDVDIPFAAVSARPDYASLIEMYTRPTTKCGPFFVGLLVGLFTLSANNPSPAQWSQMLRLQHKTVFWTGLCTAVGCVYGILPQYWYPYEGVTVYNIVYTATFRTIFAAGIGLMIVGCFLSPKSATVPFLNHSIWTVLARLTFSAALVHMPIIFLFTRVPLFQQFMSPFGLLLALPPAVLLSFTAAILFYCIVQWPISQIIVQIINN